VNKTLIDDEKSELTVWKAKCVISGRIIIKVHHISFPFIFLLLLKLDNDCEIILKGWYSLSLCLVENK